MVGTRLCPQSELVRCTFVPVVEGAGLSAGSTVAGLLPVNIQDLGGINDEFHHSITLLDDVHNRLLIRGGCTTCAEKYDGAKARRNRRQSATG